MNHEQIIMGVDIGGTGTKVGLVDTTSGELTTERFKERTPQPATPEALAEVLGRWIEKLEWKGSVGCGLPAIVQRGVARSAANIDQSWLGLNVADFFSQRFSQPFTVVNDADAAGIAEMEFGAGKGRKGVVLLLTIGTGIGSALFVDGKLIPNTELGHLKYNKSIAEKYASNAVRKLERLSWKRWGRRLNDLILHYERVLSPELIILGGGLSKNFELYQDCFTAQAEVIPAEMKNAAGVIGGAMAARYAQQGAGVMG